MASLTANYGYGGKKQYIIIKNSLRGSDFGFTSGAGPKNGAQNNAHTGIFAFLGFPSIF